MAEKRRKMSRPAVVGTLLPDAVQGSPIARCLRESAIWKVWKSAVGPQIAAKTRPTAIRGGVLTVTVANATWLQELNFLKTELRAKLNEALGEELVRDIFLKAGSLKDETAPASPGPSRIHRPLSESEERRITEDTSAIEDLELRNTLAAFFSRHLASEPAENG
jgi:hypothetical protein